MPDHIRTLRITGTIDALSPIVHHGDEKTGSTPILRAMTHWDPEQGEFVRLPFVSGNAIRGVLRRLVMSDLVDRLDYYVLSPKLHHALYTGGLLESTDETTGTIDLGFRTWIRGTFPPLGLFGTVVGNQMIPSCLRVDHAIPYCREYRAFLNGTDDPRLGHSVRTFTDFSFATRRDDLRAEREEDEQAMQMLVEFEAFVPGTRFAHGFTLVYPSELEVSCLAHVLTLWAEQPFIGGKAGSGYGRIAFQYLPPLDPEPYRRYVSVERHKLRHALDQLAARLEGYSPEGKGVSP